MELIFKSLRESIRFLSDDHQYHVINNMIFSMNLNEEDSYTALSATKFIPKFEFDYEDACMILGKDVVDKWIENGSFTDNFDPVSTKNLDYLITPEKRKQFYDVYNQGELRRTGSVYVRLHKNFTLAEIEYSVNERIKEVDKLLAFCIA
jgi:hypothetical protein